MYCIIIAGIPASGKTSLADHLARQLMARGLPFILENNFENISREGLEALLDRYSYTPVVISLTGDYRELYRRFLDRNSSPGRHRGHQTLRRLTAKNFSGRSEPVKNSSNKSQ